MKIFITTLILLFTAQPALAKSERVSSQICEPRVPTLSRDNAIVIAKDHNASASISFIDEVVLVCENNSYSWKIGFRLKEYESGHFIVLVDMDGKATSTVVKDG
ncbi:MAG: hypothetical protein JKY11_02145 [Alphaproteobacteria bacterium]|nr:hypothetical protein [Alphaproteobacteria bacterium]